MVGRLSRARATLATATAHCCSSNRLRTRKAHDRSKVYQPTASAAIRRHNDQPSNAACVFPPRRTEGLSNRIPFSFVRPALVVLRLLFSVCSPSPQKARACLPPPRREDCLHAGKNRGAPESAKRCDAFLPFTEKHFAWKTLYAQERPTRKGCPQAELRTPVCSPTRIDLEPLEEKGPPRWPKR